MAGLEIEALTVILTVAAQAVAGFAFDQVPDGRQRLETEIATTAVHGLLRPTADVVELPLGFVLGQQTLIRCCALCSRRRLR